VLRNNTAREKHKAWMGFGIFGAIVVEGIDVSWKVLFLGFAALELNPQMAAPYILKQDVGAPSIQDYLPPDKMKPGLNQEVGTSRDDFLHVSFQEFHHSSKV
jgi:hypothetical protein